MMWTAAGKRHYSDADRTTFSFGASVAGDIATAIEALAAPETEDE